MKLSVLNCLISCSALKYCFLLIDCLLGIKSRKAPQWMNGCIFGCFLLYSQNSCPLTRITFSLELDEGGRERGAWNYLNWIYSIFLGQLLILLPPCPHTAQLHYNIRTIWIYRRGLYDGLKWIGCFRTSPYLHILWIKTKQFEF